MIFLSEEQYDKILKFALKERPNEACGLLGGITVGDREIVKMVLALTNVDNSPEHFSMDPKEQFEAVREFRKNGYKLLGNFHSHPSSPARPSEEDKRWAFDPDIYYLILSLMDERDPVLKAFRINSHEVKEEKIIIE